MPPVSETRLPAMAKDATTKVIASPHSEIRQGRGRAEIAGDKRRQDEDARADGRVDDTRGQPAHTDRSYEPLLARLRVGHATV